MPRVMEDLNRDGLPYARRRGPLFFVHRVVGGEHAVLIVDGYIRDVMEVASPPFRPRAAERPRRNSDLIRARTHDRFEGDRIAADSNPARLGVVERWEGAPWGESILSSHARSIQLAIRLIPDRGQPIQIRKGSAVRDDGGVDATVSEARRLVIHFEGQLQGLGGPERLLQGVDPVVEFLVLEHASNPPVKRDCSGADLWGRGQMDRLN